MDNNINLEVFLPFLKNLSEKDRQAVTTYGKYINYSKGQSLVNNNTECTGLILVLSGQLRAYTVSDEGREITLYRLIQGDTCIMSASCMLKDISFTISLTFEVDSEVFVLPTNIFDMLSDKYPQVKSYTLDLVNGRFSDVMWVFEQFVFTKMASRLSALLVEYSSLAQSNILTVTHEELARDLGTAREVVTRMLKQLESDNLVKVSRSRIEIVDVTKLSRI